MSRVCWARSFKVATWVCVVALLVADVRGSNPIASPRFDLGQRLLFLGTRPRLILVRVEVDGRPWNDYVGFEIGRQFTELDLNQDGKLSLDEAEGVRQLAGSERLTLTRTQLGEFDREPVDGYLTLEEFTLLIHTHVSRPFALRSGDGAVAQEIHLFQRLDVDQNTRLTPEELSMAAQVLRPIDYDEDEAIGLDELQPFRNPLLGIPREAEETSGEVPFVAVDASWTPQRWRDQLAARYGDVGENLVPRLAVTTVESLRADVTRCDVDRDGWLEAGELLAACEHLDPCAVIRVELPLYENRRPLAVVEWQDPTLKSRRPRLPTSLLRWTLDDSIVEFEARPSRVQLADVRSFYMQRFIAADSSQDGQLDASELPALELGTVDIAAIDLDGDAMIQRPELQNFLQRISLGLRIQTVFTVRTNGKSLFAMLDKNLDRRLTLRELDSLAHELRHIDQNSDGIVDGSEFSGQYRIVASMGIPPLFQQQEMGMADRTSPIIRPPTDGPAWFRSMDRNRDGDLSWGEFLGTREQFHALDENEDNLVSVAEVTGLHESPAP